MVHDLLNAIIAEATAAQADATKFDLGKRGAPGVRINAASKRIGDIAKKIRKAVKDARTTMPPA